MCGRVASHGSAVTVGVAVIAMPSLIAGANTRSARLFDLQCLRPSPATARQGMLKGQYNTTNISMLRKGLLNCLTKLSCRLQL